MNVLSELKVHFRSALTAFVADPIDLLPMVRPSQDPKFGDYQANFAMPLGNRLGRPSREVAGQIVEQLNVAQMCHDPEIAGPGFINLRLRDEWIVEQLAGMVHDVRLGVPRIRNPRTFVIDYSSPNVAKPMHVGHIRSTVIGDAICRTLRFLGHHAISDNHLGDWGTQFGMIIYGYKHFLDPQAYATSPVRELERLYQSVNQLVEYQNAVREESPKLEAELARRLTELQQHERALSGTGKASDKKARKVIDALKNKIDNLHNELAEAKARITNVESDATLAALAKQHRGICEAVLEETARLHAGDEENRRLWSEFLPYCRQEIQRIYDRIQIQFDYEYGESFYQNRLAAVVQDFEQRGLATNSDGAVCLFLDQFPTPMIIRKKDGAYLYATTDLATIQYRMNTWRPDAILYVVDHRQAEHFDKLFAAARLWGYDQVELRHISFGTVLGEDGRPYRTRSGETVGLEGLLDEAVDKAYGVVCQNDEKKKDGPELSDVQRRHIARVVGHAAIKYADLSHNRTSDYVFSYAKMLALEGNTATYMQYSYARTQNIFAKGGIDRKELRAASPTIQLQRPAERALAVELLRFHQAIDESVDDFRPNQLTAYLFGLATQFSVFYDTCKVLQAETEALRDSRLLLCDLTGRTIRQGLDLLGIEVVDKM